MTNDVMFGFGAMRLDLTDKNDESSVDNDNYQKMIDYYMEQGFNYFDTSYAYHNGSSEIGLREYLVKKYPRESFRIVDKMPTWLLQSEKDNEKYVKEMLERLGTDYFDIFLIHNINAAFLNVAENCKTFDYIQKMKQEGIARKIGISYHDRADLLEKILEKYGDILDVVQLQLNYLDWESQLTESRKCYEVCEKYDMDVVVMEPIKGGTLFNLPDEIKEEFKAYNPDMSLVEWALRFAATPKNVKVVLSGMGNLEQMKENCEIFKPFKPLNDDEIEFALKMAEKIKELISIPCSYCGYCVKECPEGIPIPDYFELYNYEKMFSLVSYYSLYMTTAMAKSPASDCTYCESCVEICTQKLPIPDLLEDVADLFEQDMM